MAMEGQAAIVLDSSVLINFLVVEQLDLLSGFMQHQYVVTGHVLGEITDEGQKRIIHDAIATSRFVEANIAVDSPAGELFARLVSARQLGVGECAAIAHACANGLALGIDDRAARKSALRVCPELQVLGTDDLMALFVQANLLDYAQADVIKDRWERHHRFKLPFDSFRDRLGTGSRPADHSGEHA